MKKAILPLAAAFFALCAGHLSATTIYLYMEESCNGERGAFLTKAREGVIEPLFDAGHIVFDDASDSGAGTRLVAYNVVVPLSIARRGGADVLLTLSIESTADKLADDPRAPEKIESRGTFAIFEVGTGRRLGGGKAELTNEGHESDMGRNELGLALGRKIGRQIVSAIGKAM